MSHSQLSVAHSRYWWYVVATALLLYLVVQQFKSFHTSWSILAQADWRYIIAAALVPLVAHGTAALKYCVLSLRRLRYRPTLVVQLACLLASKLLPAGIGGVGLNFLYLRKMGHSKDQAAVVISVNDGLGVVGHLLLVGIVAFVTTGSWRDLVPQLRWNYYWVAGIAVVLVALAVTTTVYRRRLERSWRTTLRDLAVYRNHPGRLLQGLLYSIIITVCYVVSLWLSARALHSSLSLISALVVMTVGVAAATITPTPGGLVGTEAGLTAALVAYGLTLPNALAVMILYRLVSYWLSVIIGAMALIVTEKQHLV